MKLGHVLLAILLVCAVAAVSLNRYANPVPTNLAGALAALKQVEEWVKWLTQVQLAALAVLLYILLDKDRLTTRALSPIVQVFAVAGLAGLALSVFVSSWLLSALPSQLVRLHAVPSAASMSTQFDVYEVAAFGWLPWPTLGNLMSTVHWLWAVGLLALAATVVGLLLNRQRFAAAEDRVTQHVTDD